MTGLDGLEMTEPTPEEARGWLDQSVGKYFKAILNEKMNDLKDDWANGVFTAEDADTTIQLNSEALGKVGQVADIILTLDEMCKNEEPDKEEETEV